jgi:hypothetical protein
MSRVLPVVKPTKNPEVVEPVRSVFVRRQIPTFRDGIPANRSGT